MTDAEVWIYTWRYAVPTGPYEHAPGRWNHELMSAAVRDAVADRLEPVTAPTVTVTPSSVRGWSEALVTIRVTHASAANHRRAS